MSYSRIRQSMLGWVYPPVCASCEVPLSASRQLERPFLCSACEDTLELIGKGYCSVCGQSYETPVLGRMECANCSDREMGFDFAVSAYRSSGVARELVHQFKYGKRQHLARLLGTLMNPIWNDERLRQDSWWVVPVPLHPRRMRERGFNQSRELAAEMIRSAPSGIELNLLPGLKRVRHTVRQAQLDRKERLTNLSEAFRPANCLKRASKGPRRVLIVDDVITTGTTVSECAAVVRDALEIDVIAAVSVVRG